MDFFNPRVMMFEPIVEYWTVRVGLLSGGDGVADELANKADNNDNDDDDNDDNDRQAKKDKKNKKKKKSGDDNDDDKEEERVAPKQALVLHSEQRLNVNVSHALIDTMLTAYAHVQDDAAHWRKIKVSLLLLSSF
jgi:hypothetical protein